MKRTFTVRSLLAIVAVIAAGLGTMRVGTDLMAQCILTLVVVVLIIGMLGAFLKRTPAWTGFAVFAWGYFVLVYCLVPNINAVGNDLSQKGIEALADKLHDAEKLPEPALPRVNPKYLAEFEKLRESSRSNNTPRFDSIDVSMLKPGEIEQMSRYQDACKVREERAEVLRERNRNARFLGTSWMTVVFGLAGMSVGRFLASETPGAQSAGGEPT